MARTFGRGAVGRVDQMYAAEVRGRLIELYLFQQALPDCIRDDELRLVKDDQGLTILATHWPAASRWGLGTLVHSAGLEPASTREVPLCPRLSYER